ncbi:Pycsar system effector family protein [Kitasatospora sp. NPDC058243]|uniref:Pycsar system effector family protein n=1 Tax=Kitasatospora sp. NPDC058243 TaxID=3346397 RepID=UPI0036DE3238
MTTDPIDRELGIVAAEIARTDTKASTLLSAGGILAAALGLTTSGGHTHTASTVIAAAVLGAALVLAAMVIRPRLGGDTSGSYLQWADLHPNDIAGEVQQDRRAARLVALSGLCAQKMIILRWATDTTIAAVIAIAIAAALTAAN